MTDSYIAPEVIVPVFGHEFRAYRTEEGQLVYSLHSSVEGTSIPITTFRRYLVANVGKKARSMKMDRIDVKALEYLQGEALRACQKIKAQAGNSVVTINVVPKASLLAVITIAADMGNKKCQSMRDASVATVFQMAEDEALGIARPMLEYLEANEKLRKQIERSRRGLQKVSGAITNKVLGPTAYKNNNPLTYKGKTRNTYDECDIGWRHDLETVMEVMQASFKLAGFSHNQALIAGTQHMEKFFGSELKE